MANNGDPTEVPSRRPTNDNICTVCRSRPACLNFGGMTCASCKMFFRRNETYDLVSRIYMGYKANRASLVAGEKSLSIRQDLWHECVESTHLSLLSITEMLRCGHETRTVSLCPRTECLSSFGKDASSPHGSKRTHLSTRLTPTGSLSFDDRPMVATLQCRQHVRWSMSYPRDSSTNGHSCRLPTAHALENDLDELHKLRQFLLHHDRSVHRKPHGLQRSDKSESIDCSGEKHDESRRFAWSIHRSRTRLGHRYWLYLVFEYHLWLPIDQESRPDCSVPRSRRNTF